MIVRVAVALELEAYLCGVVPAEMYPSWPIEALRAQAVLARTYALYRIAHPVSAEIDLYGDHRSQAYRPDRQTMITNRAVSSTAGVYIAQADGSARWVEYVSKCGLMECPSCRGEPGHTTGSNPEGRWPGRVCQYGMHELAVAGLGYEEIIRAFVGEMELREMER